VASMSMDQLNFFSQADDNLEKAQTALVELDFSTAKKELQLARSINPFLPNQEALQEVIQYFSRFHNKWKGTAEALAAIFLDLPEAVRKKRLLLRQAEMVEQFMAQMAMRQVKRNKPFVDRGQVLHWGYCFMVIRQFEQAEKIFKESLSALTNQRADIWGYYADLCYLLNDQRQAHSAYIRSLLIDPQAIDLFRIKFSALKHLYLELLEQHSEAEARGLLLFEGWCRNVFSFLPTGRALHPQTASLQSMLQKVTVKNKAARLQKFSLHFYFDQLHREVDPDNREKMQALEKELFQRYLHILQERERSVHQQ